LTCESHAFSYLLLWWPFCEAKWNVPAKCTPRDGTDHSCNILLKSRAQPIYLCNRTIFFSIWSSGGHFVQWSITYQPYAHLGMAMITTVKYHLNPTSSSTCESRTFLSVLSSGGHFVQRSGTCRRYAQLGIVLVTSEKFLWNPTSCLTCASRTRFVIFLALVEILCSQAVHVGDLYN
jgi:hypothetical protein